MALQWRASLANEGDREALLANPDAIDLPIDQIDAGSVLVAELDTVLRGFAVVLRREDGDAELDGLFVEPDIWRAGIGRALVGAARELAQSRGARGLHVVANPEALGFYRACGFVVTGETQTRFRPAPTMKLDVSASV